MTLLEATDAMIHAKDAMDQAYWRFSRQARGTPVPMCDLAKKYNAARDTFMLLMQDFEKAEDGPDCGGL